MTRWILLTLSLLLPMLAIARKHDRPNDHDQWANELAVFAAADRAHPPAPGAVLFVGSSSIRLWATLAEDFPIWRTVNRGFGGSEIDDATYYADRLVTPHRPSAIVMYAGDNDIADGDSPEHVLADFQAFVRVARNDAPGAPIAFIAIKPSVARRALLPKIRAANAAIRQWAASQPDVSYLDVFTPMLGPDGQPLPDWFGPDGLHMNRRGYALWARIVTPWLRDHAPAARRR
ncbi:SGNH/GDSL hydrolase family protein [Dyella sp.]|jgi:lysophospholipase L1-like esterase|uniref:SGNH/GDSL hydrolase family protein n=1 Tax=Dyella sp. TaxID=1869338 RepID=UPI002D7A357A|nr:SGNH/GDSL hydrolase family protein [Dyella sp.]HET6431653.1 SGNH/GDSL hydrolase family protein [Dyella sp.]